MKKLFKHLILASLLIFPFVAIKAQTVPSSVQQTFQKKFPHAQKVSWGKENATEFEADFVLSGTHMSANFDTQGNWKETEVEISQSDLPTAVQKSLKNDYADVEVKHVFKVTQPSQTIYEVAVTNENKEMNEENEEEENEHEGNEQGEYGEGVNTHELIFTADGKLVKKE